MRVWRNSSLALILWELAIAHHIVFVGRPDGEEGRQQGGVDGIDASDLEHDPPHRDHLSHGAHLSNPMGLNGDAPIKKVEDPDSADDFEITGNHQDDEPDGQMPIDAPVDKGRHDEAGHEEQLIDQGIHDGSHE